VGFIDLFSISNIERGAARFRFKFPDTGEQWLQRPSDILEEHLLDICGHSGKELQNRGHLEEHLHQ
jgi:hypothetical protein